MQRGKLKKEFLQMVKEFDGEKAHNNIAGSLYEHYAIEFALSQLKKYSIPNFMVRLKKIKSTIHF
jgi:hypothetical protein